MTSELVSIVVPVYNVEKYLWECLYSLKEQSYKNIEVIMVNDGSTDGSRDICEKICEDKRFILINKKNGGLSSARNAGIDVARGEYITFVDSDDFVDQDFVQRLYDSVKTNDSQISIIGYQTCTDSGKVIQKFKYYRQGIVEKDEIFKSILTEECIANYAWNKLYSIQLFTHHRFPEGKAYEDVFLMYKLFDEADRISVCDDCSYFYRMRNNSITTSPSKQNLMDALLAMQNRADYISKKYPSLIMECNSSLLSCLVVFYHWCAKNGIYDSYTKSLCKSIAELLNKQVVKNNRYYDAWIIVRFPFAYVKCVYLLYEAFCYIRRRI